MLMISLHQLRSTPVSKKRHLMMDSLFSNANHVLKTFTSLFWFPLEDQNAAGIILFFFFFLSPEFWSKPAGISLRQMTCESVHKCLIQATRGYTAEQRSGFTGILVCPAGSFKYLRFWHSSVNSSAFHVLVSVHVKESFDWPTFHARIPMQLSPATFQDANKQGSQ